jgi:hypothetical protein
MGTEAPGESFGAWGSILEGQDRGGSEKKERQQNISQRILTVTGIGRDRKEILPRTGE